MEMNKTETREMISYCKIMMNRVFNRCDELCVWSDQDSNEYGSYLDKRNKYEEYLLTL
jgi:hypothetical protein